ncbi:MAG: hypothetical protein UMS36scaffold28_44 [Phage 59_13]|nr:MAG: hypothetical protein UMS36scaffold28_44 [Phage 59_13]
MNENATAVAVPAQYEPNFKAHSNLEQRARELARSIRDDASYRIACAFRIDIQKQQRGWAEAIKPAVRAAHEAHRAIKDVENAVALPLATALDTLDPAITRWRVEQEQARRLEQERINAQLRREQEDRQLEQAEELSKNGKADEAEVVLGTPVNAPEVVLPSSTRVAGIQDRVYWSAEVVDIVKLCRAIADGKVAKETVVPNFPLLNGLARSMKSALNAQWEGFGVKAVSRTDIAGGGR